jgi:membrane-associated protease RseP (regulator of RpoE activity)
MVLFKQSFLIFAIQALSLSVFAFGRAGEPTASQQEDVRTRVAWKLVDALASDSFLVREKARDGLYKLGRASIEPLEFAAQSEDSEMRLRAVELLVALRGRGFLGIGMMQHPVTSDSDATIWQLPAWQVIVNLVQQYLPADTAGLKQGDAILELNGKPVQDINDLQRDVITTGPARVLSAVIERNGERTRIPILLTVNVNPLVVQGQGYLPATLPPINLEKELPPDEAAHASETVNKGLAMIPDAFPVAQQPLAAPSLPDAKDKTTAQKIEAELQKLQAEAAQRSTEKK